MTGFTHLFPIQDGSRLVNAWTTCDSPLPSELAHVCRLRLDDRSLGVHKISSKLKHALVTPPLPVDQEAAHTSLPNTAWEAVYPAGSVNPAGRIPGGFGFYLSGPEEFAKALPGAREVLVSYSCMFERDWEWVKGGKLPGICEFRNLPSKLTYSPSTCLQTGE
jgi:hypothetical protein